MPRSQQQHEKRRLRHLWLWAVAALALLAALRGAGELLDGERGAAQWIWGQEINDSAGPVAFWAVRDVDLEARPQNAEVRIVADEAYLLWVNGWWVGSGTYRQHAPPDVWQVGPLLEPGANRLRVELRSERGVGGLWVELEADGQRLAVSDREWRIFDHREVAVERGWGDLSGGHPTVVWGVPPRGRWRFEAAGEGLPVPRFGSEHRAVRSRRSRAPYESNPWHRPPSPGHRLPKAGRILLYDFGAPVHGHAELRLPRAGGETALLYYGLDQPPDLDRDRPQELVIPLAGARSWRSATARRFRWLLVVGMELRQPAWVEPLDPLRGGRPGIQQSMPEGVFGLAPTRRRSRLEDALWKRLTAG